MTEIYLVGALFGIGVLLCASAFFPAPAPLAQALNRIHRPPAKGDSTGASSWLTRTFGESWLKTTLAERLLRGTEADRNICGVTAAELLSQRVTIALIAALWAPITTAMVVAAGIVVPLSIPIWAALALMPLGFFYPSIRLKTRAANQRRAFRHAFGSFLDIVSVSLAGGKGVESALTDGADAGSGWVFAQLRETLLAARLRGETPWSGLAQLGRDLEFSELQELAASCALAGSEGARVRMSIAAKAKALRLKGLADIETSAQSASERMSMPVVALMMGFVVFLGYPAVMAVVEGL